jgi:hypothetical protein
VGPALERLFRTVCCPANIEPEEQKKDTAHRASLTVLEQRFELVLPRNLVLGAPLPTALVRGQQPR